MPALVQSIENLGNLAQANRCVAIKWFGKIDRIAHGDLPGNHLAGPDFKLRELGLAVDRGEGAIHRVRAVGALHLADARDVVARNKREPVLPQAHLAVGVEIDRLTGIRVADDRPCPIAGRTAHTDGYSPDTECQTCVYFGRLRHSGGQSARTNDRPRPDSGRSNDEKYPSKSRV